MQKRQPGKSNLEASAVELGCLEEAKPPKGHFVASASDGQQNGVDLIAHNEVVLAVNQEAQEGR